MFFNPDYKLMGLLSYPYWFFFEMLAPVIECFGLISFIVMALFGIIQWQMFLTIIGFMISFACLYSSFAVLMEVMSYHQYKRRTDILKLLLVSLTEPFIFHPFVVWSSVKGIIDYFRNKKQWGEMERQGFSTAKIDQVKSKMRA